MKLFSHLLHIFRLPAFALLLVMASVSHAEEDIDSRRSVGFSQAELDQILAPIALYPDTVLSQVLIASTYPIEVVQAARWSNAHRSLKGAAAVAEVEDKDWDPSVKALVAFPDILQQMSDDIDWTQKLGDAFLSSEERVMDSIQHLREKAYAAGSLNKSEHLRVEREREKIIIEPAVERVVYVPVYDTRVVYGSWWWPDYPPVYWRHPASYVHISGFYWGPSIAIGPTFFYSSCHWHSRRVLVVDRHYHSSRPVFYTSRSIVSYQGARVWRHEPVHRHGVAYYNNELRTRYGSQRESYRDARVYRDQRRDYPSTRQTLYSDKNYPQVNPPRDRSEELRERINNRANSNPVRRPELRDEAADRDRNLRVQRPAENRDNRSGEQTNRRYIQPLQNDTEREERRASRAESENTDANNWGATRPALTQSESIQARRESSDNLRNENLRAREMHTDGRNTRQLPPERFEQRQQRLERQDNQQRGGRSEEDRQMRRAF